MDYKVFSGFQCFGLLGLWVFFFFLCSRSLSVLSMCRSLSLFSIYQDTYDQKSQAPPLTFWWGWCWLCEPLDSRSRLTRYAEHNDLGWCWVSVWTQKLIIEYSHRGISEKEISLLDLSYKIEGDESFLLWLLLLVAVFILNFWGFFFFPCGFNDFSGFIGLICWRFWWRIEILYIFLHVY